MNWRKAIPPSLESGRRCVAPQSAELVCDFLDRQEDFCRIVSGKDFPSMLAPRHRAKGDARLDGGFRIANLVADIERMLCLDGAPPKDLTELRCFAEHGNAAGEVR